jgi:2-polyprenyl-6-methoxyphenol hydroxylase-like FAD-dependent oxidoreductase
MEKGEILIIGAGATGLSAALFLSELGFDVRIFEKRSQRATITKALGVNPHTLQLLEKSGVTEKFLQNGWRCGCMNLWSRQQLVLKNELSLVKHPYPFMLIQPQFETEQLMEDTLRERGITVNYGMPLEDINASPDSTLLRFTTPNGQTVEINHRGIVIAADGSKSRVRALLQIPFSGWEHQESFTLYDMELHTSLSDKEGHYLLYKEGAMLMLPIKNGVWRVGGNVPDVFSFLPKNTHWGKISWETRFTIGEKVSNKFQHHRVFLLGDAAHIHSPVGARGMNLCIEDSSIFAQLLHAKRENEYHTRRYPVIKRTVGILSQLTDKIGGQNWMGRNIRSNIQLLAPLLRVGMPVGRKFILGIK